MPVEKSLVRCNRALGVRVTMPTHQLYSLLCQQALDRSGDGLVTEENFIEACLTVSCLLKFILTLLDYLPLAAHQLM